MRTACLAILVCAAMAASAQADPIFDAAADFSTSSNPNGVWSYGSTPTLGGAFTPLPFTGSFVGNPSVAGWLGFAPFSSSGEPVVVKNISGVVQQAGGMRLDPGQLGLHPGPSNEIAVVRWTAPLAGPYSVAAAFESRDSLRGATTDVHVLLNGVSIFSGSISGGFGPGSGPAFGTLLTLGAGDTIDFAVGYGSNFNFFFDSTGLSATITDERPHPVPEPATLTLLAAAMLGLVRRLRG